MRILWAVVAVLLVFWLIGAIINVVGALIHALLVIAIILVLVAAFRRTPPG
jgi:hypothetical protein